MKLVEMADDQTPQLRMALITKNMPAWVDDAHTRWAENLRSAEEINAAVGALATAQKAILQSDGLRGRGLAQTTAIIAQVLDHPEWLSFPLIARMQRCGYACAGLGGSWEVLGQVWRDQPGRAWKLLQSVEELPSKVAAAWLHVAIVGLLYADDQGKKSPSAIKGAQRCHQLVLPLFERSGKQGFIREKIVGRGWQRVLNEDEEVAIIEYRALEKSTAVATQPRRGHRL